MLKRKPLLTDGISIFASKDANAATILQEACSIEKKSFPKHMSMSECLEREIRKPRSALLLSRSEDGSCLAGYAMITWNGTAGCITKLVVRESCRRQGHGERLLKVTNLCMIHCICIMQRQYESCPFCFDPGMLGIAACNWC